MVAFKRNGLKYNTIETVDLQIEWLAVDVTLIFGVTVMTSKGL